MVCTEGKKDDNITAGFNTDHSAMSLNFEDSKNPRGPGLWKHNTSFLTDPEYVEQVKNATADVRRQYEHDNSVDDALLWEMIKLKVRETSDPLLFGARKASMRKNSVKDLTDEVTSLEKNIRGNFFKFWE